MIDTVFGNLILILSFIILSFGKNDADWCYFVKIAIFAIIVYIMTNLNKNKHENFGIQCYPNSLKAPPLVSFKSNSKGVCIDESARDLLGMANDEVTMELGINPRCFMPNDTRISADKAISTMGRGACKMPDDYP